MKNRLWMVGAAVAAFAVVVVATVTSERGGGDAPALAQRDGERERAGEVPPDVAPGPEDTTHPVDLPAPRIRPGESPPAAEYRLEDGYRLELVVDGLTYPTTVAFGPDGALYLAEAGYSYGPATAIPRVLRVVGPGRTEEVARLPDGPVTGLVWHDGALFAWGGRAPAELWRIDPANGEIETVVTGFPVWGHHLTGQLAVGPEDGRLYFSAGYPSNSGILDLDDYYQFGYLSIFREAARDIPCEGLELRLHGRNAETDNPFTVDPDDRALTGAFQRFGDRSEPGQVVETGEPPLCNGAVFSVNPDGTDLQVVAQGWRNLYGLAFAPDGRLFGVDQGMDNSGSRPVRGDFDPLWVVEPGRWYGFPDFPSGFPIASGAFNPDDREDPLPLLSEHPPVADENRFFLFAPSSGSLQFDFSDSEAFGYAGDLFIAQYGSQFQDPPPTRGRAIVRLDMETRVPHDFYVNRAPGPAGVAPERPASVVFGPDDALYLVDFGELETDGDVFFPSAETGALWRIVRTAPEPPVEKDPPTVSPDEIENRAEFHVIAMGADPGPWHFRFEEEGDEPNPTVRLRPGTHVVVELVNAGPAIHNFHVDPREVANCSRANCQIPALLPGERAKLEFDVPAEKTGRFRYWCDPHFSMGMVGQFEVVPEADR